MKKLILTRCLKLAALLVPLALAVSLAQYYLFCYTDENTGRIHDYANEEPNSLDVVFLGASDVYSGFIPGYAYDKYGFTSYLYTLADNTGLLYKNMLVELLKTQTPDLLVVEVEGFVKGSDAELKDEYRLKLFSEGVSMSLNEIDAILRFPYEDKLSILLPIIEFHGDWQRPENLLKNLKLKTSDYGAPSYLKGMFTHTVISPEKHIYDIAGDTSSSPLLPLAEKALREFLALCRQKELNVLFVRFPHQITDEAGYERFQRVNEAARIIEQSGFAFRNFEYETPQIGVSYDTDFSDAEHLNIYGTRKFTEYLGNLLVNEYGVAPRAQTDKNRQHWETCVDYTYAYFSLAEESFRIGEEAWWFDLLSSMETMDERVRQMREGAE